MVYPTPMIFLKLFASISICACVSGCLFTSEEVFSTSGGARLPIAETSFECFLYERHEILTYHVKAIPATEEKVLYQVTDTAASGDPFFIAAHEIEPGNYLLAIRGEDGGAMYFPLRLSDDSRWVFINEFEYVEVSRIAKEHKIGIREVDYVGTEIGGSPSAIQAFFGELFSTGKTRPFLLCRTSS